MQPAAEPGEKPRGYNIDHKLYMARKEINPSKGGKSTFKIAVIDGQGGGIGRIIIEQLRHELGQGCNITGLGTNAVATSVMLRAGANMGASGENAIVHYVPHANIILGSIAIIAANSFWGELTPRAAEAIAASSAGKILLPSNRSNIYVAGIFDESLPIQVDYLVSRVRAMYEQPNEMP